MSRLTVHSPGRAVGALLVVSVLSAAGCADSRPPDRTFNVVGSAVAPVAAGGLRFEKHVASGPKTAAGEPVELNDLPKSEVVTPAAPARPQPQAVRILPTAEAYAPVRENDFRTVARDPLSTFSAAVDTASYSNVRRFLGRGELPPADAVRIAELVNYFDYDYPAAEGDHPVGVTMEVAGCPWDARHKLVRIALKARTVEQAEMPPRNLVFLVDVSGSMQPANRLPLVKESLKLLVGQLMPRDRVTIVTYAGDAGLRLPPTGGAEKGAIVAAVESLRAGGSTNGGGGIRMAYEYADKNFIEGGVNRVILATDGDFNVGITHASDLARLVEQKRKTGVFLTVLGYGMGNYKDQTLSELAKHGNGHHAYIDSIAEARKVFVEQGGALAVVAKDVKLQVEFNPRRVAAYRLVGYENRLLRTEDFKDDTKDAGEMGSGHAVTALYELIAADGTAGPAGGEALRYQQAAQPTEAAHAGEWLTLKVRYKEPDGDVSKEMAVPLPAEALKRQPSADFRFAAAVAAFGMLLRDSPFKGTATAASVLAEARGALGADPAGRRAEFVALAERAAGLLRPGRPVAALE